MTAPFLAAAFMVKNEAAGLPAAFKSLEGIADVLCVLDTGSTDGTQEVAWRLGARVRDMPWKDFAASRNDSIDWAADTGAEWILVMDGDEWLSEPGDLVECLHAITGIDPTVDMISFPHHCVGDSLMGGDCPMVRVFRGEKVRDKSIRYVFPVHAQPTGWRHYSSCGNARTSEHWNDADSIHSAERSIPVLEYMLAKATRPTLVSLNGESLESQARVSAQCHALRYLAKSHGLLAGAAKTPEETAKHYAVACAYAQDLVKLAPDDPYDWLILIGIAERVTGLMSVGPLVVTAMRKFPRLKDLHWWSMRIHAATLAQLSNEGEDYPLVPQRAQTYMPRLGEVAGFLSMRFGVA